MTHKWLNKDLSAYLDGEAKDPAAVERLLESDEDAKDRYDQLEAVSAQFRSLKAPKRNRRFVAGVMARVADEEPVGFRGRFRVLAPVLATAAAVMITLSIWSLRDDLGQHVLDPVEHTNWASIDEDALLTEIESLVDENPEALQDALAYASTWGMTDASTDTWVDLLADSDWFPDFAEVIDTSQDLDGLLATMDDTESEFFQNLLVEFAQEG